jgi:hypothetical protein
MLDMNRGRALPFVGRLATASDPIPPRAVHRL